MQSIAGYGLINSYAPFVVAIAEPSAHNSGLAVAHTEHISNVDTTFDREFLLEP